MGSTAQPQRVGLVGAAGGGPTAESNAWQRQSRPGGPTAPAAAGGGWLGGGRPPLVPPTLPPPATALAAAGCAAPPPQPHLARLPVASQGSDLEGWVQRQQPHHLLACVAGGTQHRYPHLVSQGPARLGRARHLHRHKGRIADQSGRRQMAAGP